MGLFSKLFSRKPAVPDWASFFSLAQYERFNELVLADFTRRGQTASLRDGCAFVEGAESGQGLQNLAQTCHMAGDEALWPTVIRDHFERLERTMAQLESFQKNMADFEAAKPFLTVRLYPADHAEQAGPDNLVLRHDLEGTVTVLALDLPDAVMTVSPSMAKAWERPAEELFATALDWLRADATAETGQTDLGGVKLYMVASDGFYAASQVLRLKELDGFVGSFGALVGVPHRHGLLAYPIEGAGVLPALQKLLPAVRNMYQQGPGSISPDLFWFHDGAFTRLPVTVEGKNLVFAPPAAFQELLGRLAAEGRMEA